MAGISLRSVASPGQAPQSLARRLEATGVEPATVRPLARNTAPVLKATFGQLPRPPRPTIANKLIAQLVAPVPWISMATPTERRHLRGFSKGERRDSNPRPPGPQLGVQPGRQPIEVRERAGPALPPVDVYQALTTRTRPATPCTRPRQGPARFAGASCPGLTALPHLQAGSTTHSLPKPP